MLNIFPYKIYRCHILEFWLSPTLMIFGNLQSHLQSCIATSPYAREVDLFYFTNIDILYISLYFTILVLWSLQLQVQQLLVIHSYFIFFMDLICYLFSSLAIPLFLYLSTLV